MDDERENSEASKTQWYKATIKVQIYHLGMLEDVNIHQMSNVYLGMFSQELI